MKVYVEFVVFNNLAVNALLLYWSSILAKRPIKPFFIALSSLLGTVFAVFLPFARYNGIIFFKLLLPFTMCAVLHNYKNFKQYAAVCGLFCAFTFLLGGGVLAIADFGRTDLAQKFDFGMGVLSGAIASLALVLTYAAKVAAYRISRFKRKTAFECDVRIFCGGSVIAAKGFLDSGNRLYCKNAVPVIVIDKSLIGNIPLGREHKIKVKTVTDTKYLDGFFPDRIELVENGQARVFDNVAAAVSESEMSLYKVILHGDMAC